MVSIRVENLGLAYRIREKLTLAIRDRRVTTGGDALKAGAGRIM